MQNNVNCKVSEKRESEESSRALKLCGRKEINIYFFSFSFFSEQANANFRESGRDLVETWSGSVRLLDTFGGIKSQIF